MHVMQMAGERDVVTGLLRRCRIECAQKIVLRLLFADDTAFLAPDESWIKKSLDVLVQWCRLWGVKINMNTCCM